MKVKVKTKIFYLCLMLSITCVFLSEVVLNGAPVGTEMAVHFLRGPSKPVLCSRPGPSNGLYRLLRGSWGGSREG